MTEPALHLAKEAKSLQQALKEALKTRDPWDREVEFQRKNLRWQYLRLLLIHPYARESKDAETYLWMQTSYAFISVYKQRLATLDRTLQSAPRHQQPRQGGPGPVEHRKLMQRFRQFLAEEEKFWTQLIVRFRRSFGLEEAQPALVQLGILTAADDASTPNLPDAADPKNSTPPAAARNHFQFPPEDSVPPAIPQTDDEREGRLAILSKALVCLGDIARYRELYNEAGGRPKAGQEDSALPARKGGRGRRGAAGVEMIPRARNYEKAESCYKQAQLLLPYEGNPSHQLAILASYQKDIFASIFHYYRALCVRQPYDTASENLGTVLHKALEQWKSRMRRDKERDVDNRDGSLLAPRVRVETFKDRVVALHALWRLGVDKMESISPKHAENILSDFTGLVAERHLPIDTIFETVVLAQGALWKHRMIRDPQVTSGRKPGTSPTPSFSPVAVESSIASHLLALHQVLLKIGVAEIAETTFEDGPDDDLAQRITAPFRRTLPALRVAGKWLRANLKYVIQGQKASAPQEKGKESTVHKKSERRRADSELAIAGIPKLWDTYARFANALLDVFPAERLPPLNKPLREDVELRGFLPVRKYILGEVIPPTGSTGGENMDVGAPGGHPNEEQLMRISDLIEDAKALVEVENSPIVLHNGRFSVRGSKISAPQPFVPRISQRRDTVTRHHVVSQHVPLGAEMEEFGDPLQSRESDEDAMTEASRTTDDPVGDAFRKVLDGSDEEDEIVWNPRPTLSPIGTAIPTALPSSPGRSPISPSGQSFTPRGATILSPQGQSPFTPPPMATAPVATTAQDLLDNMGLSRNLGGANMGRSTAPQPQLLFGSGPPDGPGHSIWSTALDNRAPTLKGIGSGSQFGHSRSQSQQFSLSPPQSSAQPHWPSSYMTSSQSSQNYLGGTFPSASQVPQSRPIFNGTQPSSLGQNYDALGYTQPTVAQGPITYGGAPPAYSNPLQEYHGHHLHHQHDRSAGQTFGPPPISQLWGTG